MTLTVQTARNLFCMQVNFALKESGIEIREYDAVSEDVVLLESGQLNSSLTDVQGNGTKEEGKIDLIWADPRSCCYALYSKLNSDKVLMQQSPLALAKALKVVHALCYLPE